MKVMFSVCIIPTITKLYAIAKLVLFPVLYTKCLFLPTIRDLRHSAENRFTPVSAETISVLFHSGYLGWLTDRSCSAQLL